MSKFGPAVGDVGVIGTLRSYGGNAPINRNALCSVCWFDPNITANGYASAAQNIEAMTGVGCGPLRVSPVPDGLNTGDWVTADITELNGVAIATNVEAL